MAFFKTKSKSTLIEFIITHFNEQQSWRKKEDSLEILVDLVRYVRPKNALKSKEVNLEDFIQFLNENTNYCQELSIYIKELLRDKKFNKILSDAAILQDFDFIFELKKRIYAKILPNQPKKNTLEYILNQVFYLASDVIWINKIPLQQVEALYELLEFETIYKSTKPNSPLYELLMGLSLISQRTSGRVMETDIIRMVPEFDDTESPFIQLEKKLIMLQEEVKMATPHYISSSTLVLKEVMDLHKECELFIDKAFKNSSKYGISLRVNQKLLKIKQQLQRIKVVLPLLIINKEKDQMNNGIALALQLIKYNCYKNNIRKFISESTQLISYEITQHTAKTGENYVTENRKQYFNMFQSALGGGFIVGILCIIKVLLSKVDTSYFGSAFLYSMNYILGFITIYLLGFTLATKQPAMTASVLIKALEDDFNSKHPKGEKYTAFSILFARVFRSQFIAFVGNVIMAFPVALLGIALIDYALEYNIAEQKWNKLISDISPIHSLAIFHSAIAGVFLFLSGIISGSVANRDKYHQIYYRIAENPLLKKIFGKRTALRWSKLYEKKWAGIISNFWFGIFMGSTASVGLFLGLDLDIRHITFASGNLALGLYGANYNVSHSMLFWGIFGIGCIGLVNFLMSFILSLSLAFRSRAIPFSELRYVMISIWNHFKLRPMSFFFPTEKSITEVLK